MQPSNPSSSSFNAVNSPMLTGPKPDALSGRRVVATYTTYAEASRAVDFLSDRGFAVQRVAIVAEGLRLVEQITGRLNWGMAVGQGALSGALTGLFFALLFGLLNFIQPLVPVSSLALSGLVFGAVIGAVLGLIAYAFSGGRRDFVSVGGVQADRYNLLADIGVAEEAEVLLREMR